MAFRPFFSHCDDKLPQRFNNKLLLDDRYNGDQSGDSDSGKTAVFSEASSYRDAETPPGPPAETQARTWCEGHRATTGAEELDRYGDNTSVWRTPEILIVQPIRSAAGKRTR